ncbi:MAG TPA: hypothetical protein IAB34_02155 [Candidatus Egerieimonas faecigallinarum]|nr:hypothetical protein [Candidatus Egerieimonas faecigallinarum]
MYHYTVAQWLLFFFVYCFIGWVWESCYVSARKRRWVNRGFMHGPLLPIYGSGAVIILLATMPVRDNLVLIFVFGMIGATILEYCTGACMEKLFKMKYWDYSNYKFNLNGHICLQVSLGWGVFSIALVRGLHLPVEYLVLKIPDTAAEIAAYAITVAAAVDFTQSFNEAMDLKEIITRLSESNERIQRIQSRLEAISAFTGSEYQEYMKKWQGLKELPWQSVSNMAEEYRSRKRQQLQILADKINEVLAGGQEKAEEFTKFKEQVERDLRELGSRPGRSAQRALRLLKRNPDTSSKKYSETLKDFKEIIQKRKKL